MKKHVLLGSAVAMALLAAGCSKPDADNATASDVTLNDESVTTDGNLGDLNATDFGTADGNSGNFDAAATPTDNLSTTDNLAGAGNAAVANAQ